MCDNCENQYVKSNCEGYIINTGDGEFKVKGRLLSGRNVKILFWAPNPPSYNTSFSGSGLPYPNAKIAFDNTPNRGSVETIDGNFEFNIRYPNAYYKNLGSLYVEPSCYIKICGINKIHTIKLGHGIPFRLLTYPNLSNIRSRNTPLFYERNNVIANQETLLRLRGYPDKNIMPKNFW